MRHMKWWVCLLSVFVLFGCTSKAVTPNNTVTSNTVTTVDEAMNTTVPSTVTTTVPSTVTTTVPSTVTTIVPSTVTTIVPSTVTTTVPSTTTTTVPSTVTTQTTNQKTNVTTKQLFTKRTTVTTTSTMITTTALPINLDPIELTQNIVPADVVKKQTDERFVNAYLSWAVDLFKVSVCAKQDENTLISPLSMQLALSVAANGADGITHQEIVESIGGGLPMGELNSYMYTFAHSLTVVETQPLMLANSVWLREDKALSIQPDFLKTVSAYYGTSIYSAAFNQKTLNWMNDWASENTKGLVTSVLDGISPLDEMFVLNTAVFDDVWKYPYRDTKVENGVFYTINGDKRTVSMMQHSELNYYDDGKAVGFSKEFKNDRFAFTVLLPNEDVNLYEYIDSLTAQQLQNMLSNPKSAKVYTKLPKFECTCSLEMDEILQELGIREALTQTADFSKLIRPGNLTLKDIRHKVHLTIDEAGARAGAASVIPVRTLMGVSSGTQDEIVEITLDRPFVYMITETQNNLPIFFGVLTDIGE